MACKWLFRLSYSDSLIEGLFKMTISKDDLENRQLQQLQQQVGINKSLKVLPTHRELEFLATYKKIEYDQYTIAGLYDVRKIHALMNNSNAFYNEKERLKEIVQQLGKDAFFTPAISIKALGTDTTNNLCILQEEAGFDRISIFEKNNEQSVDEMTAQIKEIKNKFKDKKLFPVLSVGINKRHLLKEKVIALKKIGFSEIGVYFSGYWKYKNNILELSNIDRVNRPNIVFCGIWERLNNTPLPVVMALFGFEKISSGFKWGATSRGNKKPALRRLDEMKIAYYVMPHSEIEHIRLNERVMPEDIYKFIKAESYQKSVRIIERLKSLGSNSLNELVQKNKYLNYLFA